MYKNIKQECMLPSEKSLKLISSFYDTDCIGQIYTNDNWNYVIKGQFTGIEGLLSKNLRFWASSPADMRQSYSGSGLPYPNSDIALIDSPNNGVIELSPIGSFQLNIIRPNSYYVNQGNTLIPPQLSFRLDYNGSKIYNIKIGDPIPHRSLSSLPGCIRRSTGR